MQTSNNCSEKLSREHYLSKSILDQFGEKILVTGFRWLEVGEEAALTSKALASNILCERHNNALSPLDIAAGNMFEQITEAATYVTKKSLARKTRYFFTSGDAFELWGAKLLMGIVSSKVASTKGRAIIEDHSFDTRSIAKALTTGRIPSPLGMYVHREGTETVHKISVAPLSWAEEKVIVGLRVSMWGLHFDFILDPRGPGDHFVEEEEYYRPVMINLNGPKRSACLVLTWEGRRYRGPSINVGIRSR